MLATVVTLASERDDMMCRECETDSRCESAKGVERVDRPVDGAEGRGAAGLSVVRIRKKWKVRSGVIAGSRRNLMDIDQ